MDHKVTSLLPNAIEARSSSVIERHSKARADIEVKKYEQFKTPAIFGRAVSVTRKAQDLHQEAFEKRQKIEQIMLE